jgi:hypothetical protein
MASYKNNESKIKLLKLFVENGANLNIKDSQGRSKGHRAWKRESYFIFEMMDQAGFTSKINQIEKKDSKVAAMAVK